LSWFRARAEPPALRLVVLAVLWLLGCEQPSETTLTQVTARIVLDDESLRSVMTELRVRATLRLGEASWRKPAVNTFPAARLSWPVEIPIFPRSVNESAGQFEIVAEALEGQQLIAEARVITSFLPNKYVRIDLRLRACPGASPVCDSDCVGVGCSVCAASGICEQVAIVPPGSLQEIPRGSGDGSDAAASPPFDAGSGDADLLDGATSVAVNPDAGANGSNVCLGSPGQVLCNDTVLSHCNAQGQVEKQETCASARHCQFGVALKACAPCDPGTRRCTGARIERCAQDGATWELVKVCESEALCNSVAGDCVAGACTASTRLCMSDGLYGCSEDLSRLTRIAPCTAAMCDQTNGECDVCLAGTRACNNNVSEVCDSRGQSIMRTPCAGSTPKCSGSGQCVQCTSGGDCPAPSNSCVTATCNAGTASCETTPRAAHVACSAGVCDGSGTCVECADDTECRTGAPRCVNGRCVACTSHGDCAANYECVSNQCQRITLAGSARDCVYFNEPSGGQCGAYYCGASTTRFNAVFDPAGTCGPNAMFNCNGGLFWIGFECTFGNVQATNPQTAAMECARSQTTVPSSISNACLTCFLNEAQCCRSNANCLAACTNGRGTSACDNARRASGCLNTLFSCAGLPNPL
jgi:hypothetical protein